MLCKMFYQWRNLILTNSSLDGFANAHYVYIHIALVSEIWAFYWSLSTDFLKNLHWLMSKLSCLSYFWVSKMYFIRFKNVFDQIFNCSKITKRLLRHGKPALNNGVGFSYFIQLTPISSYAKFAKILTFCPSFSLFLLP